MAERIHFPATGVSVEGKAVLLAIDDVSLPLRHKTCLYLSRPRVRRAPVLTPSADANAPDANGAHFYGTVLYENGRYRMWYYACHLGINPDWPPEIMPQVETWGDGLQVGPICYAESEDGIEWVKPNIGQVVFKGSRDNNAIGLPDPEVATATLIRDDDDADPKRRYKMVYNYYDRTSQNPAEQSAAPRTAVSPDGIQWTAGPRLMVESFIEHSSLYKFNGLYMVNGQKIGRWCPGEGGSDRGRQGFVHVSTDFDSWLPGHCESFALPDPPNPGARGAGKPYDQVHLGVGAASFGNVLVGLYGLWHDAPVFGNISADLGLLVSNDGLHFREPVKHHAYIRREDSPATPARDRQYNTILCQGHGILNVGKETRIYHGRWRNVDYTRHPGLAVDYYSETALATLPRDRWGAIGLFPDAAAGSVWSAPVTIPQDGCIVYLNAEGAKGMRVEVSDESFNLIDAFSGDNSGVVKAPEGLACRVSWPKKIAGLGGKTVRLRVHMEKSGADPRLYAVYLLTHDGTAALET